MNCPSAVDVTDSLQPSEVIGNEVRGQNKVRGQGSQIRLRHQTSSPSSSSILSSGPREYCSFCLIIEVN